LGFGVGRKKGLRIKRIPDLLCVTCPLHLKYKPKFIWVKGHAGILKMSAVISWLWSATAPNLGCGSRLEEKQGN